MPEGCQVLLITLAMISEATQTIPLNPFGKNVCQVSERFNVTVQVEEDYLATYRVTEWCLSIPPRCTRYKQYWTKRKVPKLVEHERKVEQCCPGYVPNGSECKAWCEQPCRHGTCALPNTCYCFPGFRGPLCHQVCKRGTWGGNCVEKCECHNDAYCNPMNGVCVCSPGWQGNRCTDQCNAGYFGYECRRPCNCEEHLCQHVTGDCFYTTTEFTTTELVTKEESIQVFPFSRNPSSSSRTLSNTESYSSISLRPYNSEISPKSSFKFNTTPKISNKPVTDQGLPIVESTSEYETSPIYSTIKAYNQREVTLIPVNAKPIKNTLPDTSNELSVQISDTSISSYTTEPISAFIDPTTETNVHISKSTSMDVFPAVSSLYESSTESSTPLESVTGTTPVGTIATSQRTSAYFLFNEGKTVSSTDQSSTILSVYIGPTSETQQSTLIEDFTTISIISSPQTTEVSTDKYGPSENVKEPSITSLTEPSANVTEPSANVTEVSASVSESEANVTEPSSKQSHTTPLHVDSTLEDSFPFQPTKLTEPENETPETTIDGNQLGRDLAGLVITIVLSILGSVVLLMAVASLAVVRRRKTIPPAPSVSADIGLFKFYAEDTIPVSPALLNPTYGCVDLAPITNTPKFNTFQATPEDRFQIELRDILESEYDHPPAASCVSSDYDPRYDHLYDEIGATAASETTTYFKFIETRVNRAQDIKRHNL